MARKAKPKKKAPKAWHDTVQLKLRFSEGLRRHLEREAATNGRSMNSEIVARLEQSLQMNQDANTLLAQAVIEAYPDLVERIGEIVGEQSVQQEIADQQQADYLEEHERDKDK